MHRPDSSTSVARCRRAICMCTAVEQSGSVRTFVQSGGAEGVGDLLVSSRIWPASRGRPNLRNTIAIGSRKAKAHGNRWAAGDPSARAAAPRTAPRRCKSPARVLPPGPGAAPIALPLPSTRPRRRLPGTKGRQPRQPCAASGGGCAKPVRWRWPEASEESRGGQRNRLLAESEFESACRKFRNLPLTLGRSLRGSDAKPLHCSCCCSPGFRETSPMLGSAVRNPIPRSAKP